VPRERGVYLVKFERAFLVVFNALLRYFGVLSVLFGIVFLISAARSKDHLLADAIVGTLDCAMGVTFLIAKRVGPEYLDKFRW
jgi:hypothetical protein